ncbi:MAG: hypothetical protein WD512_18290 [Candidatus Paceibacterota bacterium]
MTLIISHRGNLSGPNPQRENAIDYIYETIARGYCVEIDIRYKNKKLWLGHDTPQEEIELFRLYDDNLIIHCKDLQTFQYIRFVQYDRVIHDSKYTKQIHYFYHENDAATLTSKGFIWVHPTKLYEKGFYNGDSIAVLPEQCTPTILVNASRLKNYAGICTDYSTEYRKELK